MQFTEIRRCAVAIAFVLTTSANMVFAEPVEYSSVELSLRQSFDGELSADTVATVRLTSLLDLTAKTQFLEVTGFSQTKRLLLLDDPSDSGDTLTGVDIPQVTTTSPIPIRSLEQTGRVITFGTGMPGATRLVMSPAGDLLVSMSADERPNGAVDQTYVTASLQVRAADTLLQSDLIGSYALFVYDSVLGEDTSQTSLQSGLEELLVDFAGDGSCSAQSGGLTYMRLTTTWPDLSGRTTPRVRRAADRQAQNCSYTVDPEEGSATLVLEYLVAGGTEQVTLPLLVSDEGRYLIGEEVRVENLGSATNRVTVGIIGVRAFSAPTNQTINGVHLLSMIGGVFTDAGDRGVEQLFASRYALDLSGALPDAEGYSACTVLGTTRAGSQRALGGAVPDAIGVPYLYNDEVGPAFSQCRYRVLTNGSISLEFRAEAGDWLSSLMRLADDGATLVGGSVTTSADPLSAGVESALPAMGSSLIWFGVAQQADALADSPEIADFSNSFILPVDPDILLAASILPSSRSVSIGTNATAFATVINASSVDAQRCRLRAPADSGIEFSFQQTDSATNEKIGRENELVDIPAGESRSFIFTLRSEQELRETELAMRFVCVNSNAAVTYSGINTLLFSAEETQAADVIALAATLDQDGVVKLDPASDSGVFSMATINLGASSDVSVTVDSGDAALDLTLSMCQTDPVTGVCVNPVVPSSQPVVVRIETGESPTFGVFASGTTPIALDAANNRLFVRVRDPAGVVRGGTSVAVTTEAMP